MAEPLKLAELLEALGEARNQSADLYKRYKEVKEVEDGLREALFEHLRETGLKSAKGKQFAATIVETPTIVVTHEQSVIDWLDNTPDIERDLYVGLRPSAFQTLAKSVLKGTGEIIPGTELINKESLAIRANKKKGK